MDFNFNFDFGTNVWIFNWILVKKWKFSWRIRNFSLWMFFFNCLRCSHGTYVARYLMRRLVTLRPTLFKIANLVLNVLKGAREIFHLIDRMTVEPKWKSWIWVKKHFELILVEILANKQNLCAILIILVPKNLFVIFFFNLAVDLSN